MNNHLPLVIGTSMRHSDINQCDVDRPVAHHDKNIPHACISLVYFDSEESMIEFRRFFTTRHPEAMAIRNDEQNYTTISPMFVAAKVERSVIVNDPVGFKLLYRVRIMWPYVHGISPDNFVSLTGQLLNNDMASKYEVVAIEQDRCLHGITEESNPDYAHIWSVCFADKGAADSFVQYLSDNDTCQDELTSITCMEPEILVSEVFNFDMSKTAPYRNRQ